MRPTYAALVVTAVLVFVVQTIAQDYLMLNEAAGILGGVVLGVSVVTWVYSIIISAALAQFFSLSPGIFNYRRPIQMVGCATSSICLKMA